MAIAARFKKQVLNVLDPGRKNRDVLSIRPSGAVEINTNKILSSMKGRSHIRTMEKMAAAQDERESA